MSNLSALFQRMLSEPKSKQHPESKVQQFVVLNHILFSNIATIATTLLSKEPKIYPEDLLVLAKKTERKLITKETDLPVEKLKPTNAIALSGDDVLMKEQLQFIYEVSKDIEKLTKTIV